MKKRILFVINTLGRAGAETAMLALVKRLDPEKFDISVFVILGQGELRSEFPAHVRFLNEEYSDLSVFTEEGQKNIKKNVIKALCKEFNFLRYLPFLISNGFRMLLKGKIQPDKLLWRVLADAAPRFDETFDLAISYIEGGAAYYTAEHVNASKKVVFVHIDYESSGYNRHLDRGCFDSFDRIYTVSGEVKKHFLAVYPEYNDKTNIFHNLIDTQMVMQKAASGTGFKDVFSGIRILTVGRLTYQKGYDVAVHAMKELKAIKPDLKIHWYVLGEGPERDRISQLIKKFGLEEEFILLGAVDNPFPYYSQADIYVHATRYEGKSIAIQEAKIFKCPIIASDCNGNREQVTHMENGILCSFEPVEIAKSIAMMIDSPELREKLRNHSETDRITEIEDLNSLYNLLGSDFYESI